MKNRRKGNSKEIGFDKMAVSYHELEGYGTSNQMNIYMISNIVSKSPLFYNSTSPTLLLPRHIIKNDIK